MATRSRNKVPVDTESHKATHRKESGKIEKHEKQRVGWKRGETGEAPKLGRLLTGEAGASLGGAGRSLEIHCD